VLKGAQERAAMSGEESRQTDQEISEILKMELAVALECSPNEVDLSERLTDLPGIDSMKLVQVVVACEQRWNIAFDEEELFDVRTGADMCALTIETLAAGAFRP
jgi:acyl carrier protein